METELFWIRKGLLYEFGDKDWLISSHDVQKLQLNCHDKYIEQLKYCKPSGVSLTTFVPQEAVIIVS